MAIADDMKSRLVAALLSIVGVTQCQTSSPAKPDTSEQQKALADAAQYAMNHEGNLPNFICTQTTRSFEDFNNSGWRPIDLVVERLTYFDHHEVYKVLTLNSEPVSIAHDQLRGASSSGEFGSIMRAIFLPETETAFTWRDWFTLRGKSMQVYAYQVRAFRSRYHIEVSGQSLDLVAAYHGLIFIDSENHFVHRITLHPDGIPPSFPIQDINLTLDYEYNRIGDADYLLPVQFELRSREGDRLIRSDVDYDNYRKFSAVSAITFNSPGAIKQ
jgi:hypothetical protein